MTGADRAATLLARAGVAIAAAQRDIEAGDAVSAADRALAAMLALASACLATEPETADAPPAPTRSAAIAGAYGAAFGRGGRLYSAYFRWLLDARDLSLAVAAGSAGSDDMGAAETAVERAGLFRDAVERYLARVERAPA